MATKQDIQPADRGEFTPWMEPLRLNSGSRFLNEMTDLAVELAQRASGLRRSLPDSMVETVADMVRSMNCYYSNLIEGHNTHPIDIERALHDDYSDNTAKRNLQLEAKAHVTVQAWIDGGGLKGRQAVTVAGIREIHRRFCELLPDDLLWVEDPEGKERARVAPGELRTRDVRVGKHIAISPGAVPRFLDRFEEVYSKLGKMDSILSTAIAHHRLARIHPFLDGNGRVARLVSHATMLETLETGGLWSIARGLARNDGKYKTLLANCDLPRRNDLDGRGNLSEEATAEFIRFFLTISIDQVEFMESVLDPNRLRTRILIWAEEETRMGLLPAKSGAILEALLYRGELPRGDAAVVTALGDRQARRVVSALLDRGVLKSESSRAPLRLVFPAVLASRWMPGLFPEKTG